MAVRMSLLSLRWIKPPRFRKMARSKKIRLFVGGLDFSADKAHVDSLLSPYGEVIDVFLSVYRKHKGAGEKNRGFAFVEMSREDGLRAIQELNDSTDESSGRKLTVREATKRKVRKRR